MDKFIIRISLQSPPLLSQSSPQMPVFQQSTTCTASDGAYVQPSLPTSIIIADGRDSPSTSSQRYAAPPATQGQHLHLKAPNDPCLKEGFPKGNEGRGFKHEWLQRFPWIEYSIEKKAAYCYACRIFQPHGSKELSWTHNGFANWKAALDKKGGFYKHAASEVHIRAMSMWNERELRLQGGQTISLLLNDKVIAKNRYYMQSIVEIIQFLTVNELALRGRYDIEEAEEKSLFRSLFEFTLQRDEKLAECCQHIPANANYQSPDIQNEVITLMTEIVREDIVQDIKTGDVPWYTLLEDGMRDRNNRENVALAIRYVKDGKAQESLLSIEASTKLDASSFTCNSRRKWLGNGLLIKPML